MPPETPSPAALEAIAVMLKPALAVPEAAGTEYDFEVTAEELLIDCALEEAEFAVSAMGRKPEGTGTVVYTLDTCVCVIVFTTVAVGTSSVCVKWMTTVDTAVSVSWKV
jgi:hypothetical protein